MPFKPRTFIELCYAMQTNATVNIDGYIGFINAIEREDGSGHSFNVTLFMTDGVDKGENRKVYFRS